MAEDVPVKKRGRPVDVKGTPANDGPGTDSPIEHLRALCDKWQRRLRLEDWKIDLRLVRHYELEPGTAGNFTPVLERKEAVIKILVAGDRFESCLQTTEEQTLVHELLHCHFESFWYHGKRTEMEQAINLIADALVGK